MAPRWQKVSSDGGLFSLTTISLSTVEMPRISGMDFGYKYESCLFSDSGSEVVDRYQTLDQAVAGHAALCRKYGLKQ